MVIKKKRFAENFPFLKDSSKIISFSMNAPVVEETVLNQARKEKNILYGARSINAQTFGLTNRNTFDFDIFSKSPKKSAMSTEKALDKKVYGNQFYTKPAKHPGTWKVMHVGNDMKAKTKDDVGFADYTKTPNPKPKTILINGIRYRRLSEERRAKLKSLSEKEMAFRHAKDRADLNNINVSNRIRRFRLINIPNKLRRIRR